MSVYILRVDYDSSDISAGHSMRESSTFTEAERWEFMPERNSPNLSSRIKVIQNWRLIEVSSFSREDYEAGIEGLVFLDAVSYSAPLMGFHTLVSNSAKEKLEPYIKDECAFLPLTLVGAPEQYWVLYVTKIVNCLDMSRSKFGKFSPRSIRLYFFHEENISSRYLFRLPGPAHLDYMSTDDFATEAFRALVNELDISGFTFIEPPKKYDYKSLRRGDRLRAQAETVEATKTELKTSFIVCYPSLQESQKETNPETTTDP